MASLYEFKMDITGFSGAPGVNILHTTTGVSDDLGDMGNFMSQMANGWTSIKAYLNPQATFTVNAEVLKKNVETGLLEGVFSVPPPDGIAGTGLDSSMPHYVQAVARHNTDKVTAKGRRLIGRHFIGPLAGDAIDVDGTLKAGATGAITAMWDGMQDVSGTCRLITWHRPSLNQYQQLVPGELGHVQNTICHDWPGVLRSRRD